MLNMNRNRSIPIAKKLPYHKYYGEYIKVPEKVKKDQDYYKIIRPVLKYKETSLADK